METDRQYEGWANYQTWAIALEISNDEPKYRRALGFMADYGGKKSPYKAFIEAEGISKSLVWPTGRHTFTYGTRKANRSELDDFMRGLIGCWTQP
jgi:hypothetical protein